MIAVPLSKVEFTNFAELLVGSVNIRVVLRMIPKSVPSDQKDKTVLN